MCSILPLFMFILILNILRFDKSGIVTVRSDNCPLPKNWAIVSRISCEKIFSKNHQRGLIYCPSRNISSNESLWKEQRHFPGYFRRCKFVYITTLYSTKKNLISLEQDRQFAISKLKSKHKLLLRRSLLIDDALI